MNKSDGLTDGRNAAKKGSVLRFSRIALARRSPAHILLCMARKLRLHYPGAIYHAMDLGARRLRQVTTITLEDRGALGRWELEVFVEPAGEKDGPFFAKQSTS